MEEGLSPLLRGPHLDGEVRARDGAVRALVEIPNLGLTTSLGGVCWEVACWRCPGALNPLRSRCCSLFRIQNGISIETTPWSIKLDRIGNQGGWGQNR